VLSLISCFLLAFCLEQAHCRETLSENGATYLHRVWTTENGLPQNSVTSILQTQDGYLWLGTLGGLARFDGINFTIFNTANTGELKSNRISALYQDGEGSLWIGSEHGGLSRYYRGAFTNYSLRDGLPSDSVLSLGGDGKGGLWIGTLAGVAHLRDGKFIRYGPEAGLPRTAIHVIYQDLQGNVWIGAHGIGLIRFSGGKATVYGTRSELRGEVSAIHQGRDGTLWIGTQNGLTHFNAGKFSGEWPKQSDRIGWVWSICDGDHLGMWVATNHGVFRVTNGMVGQFSANDGQSEMNARSIFVDSEQDLWIGTDGDGLDRWRKSNVRAFVTEQGLTNQPTMSILQDRAGTIWIGAIGEHSLFSYRNGRFSAYPDLRNGIHALASLAEAPEGNLWLGDWNSGLSHLDLKNNELKDHILPGLSADTVRALYVDSKGFLWIGADQTGLYQFKNGAVTNYRTNAGLLNNTVVFITEDRDGAMWLGTPAGVSRFKDGVFINYTAPALSLVRAIHKDAAGVLWVGTYGYGLFCFVHGRFVQITAKDGLFDDVVSSILEDKHGNFWMGGNRGIFRARQSDLSDFVEGRSKAIQCVSFGVADGMVTSETNGNGEPSALKARDGKLWFTMIKGAVAIDPDVSNTQPPPIAIEAIVLDGNTLPPDQPVRIQPGTRSLEIHYTALSLSRPERVTFKYRLTGFDSDWVDAGSRRTAYYSRLPPGNYVFHVIADNGDGVWNMTGKSFQVNVLPHFWETTWFITSAIAVLIGFGTLAYRVRAMRWERARATQETFSRQLLASQEAERQRIAAELHDSLGQSLLIIKNRAMLALNSFFADPEATREQLEEISAGASYAVEEVREISYNLRPYQLDRFGLSKSLQALCTQASKSSGISFAADVGKIDNLFPKESESSIYRIVQEAVNNVIKHSRAQDATLTVRQNNSHLQLIIHDNGQGFQSGETRSAELQPGGFGLIGMAERVRMLKGNFDIESALGGGTTITIQVPVPEQTNA